MTQEIIEDEKYSPSKIEKKWQNRWDEAKIFNADVDKTKEKYHINFPFPYVNGAPHLGHGYSLLKAEIMARFQRMLGKNVLFPFAFHATGEPIVGTSKRLKAGDQGQINSLIMSGVPKEEIDNFKEPVHIVNYFKNKWIEMAQAIGLAIDWRRQFVTTQLTPTFSKFVEWQYRKLKAEGYVVQGSHPVIWCPVDRNPTGDHDRLEGEGVRVVEFVLLKFWSKSLKAFFIPATLRPETVFGVTNMFIHPTAKYVKANINGEDFIISKDAVIKFEDQKFKVSDIEDVLPKDLIGTSTINPLTKDEVIVLPGEFIDPAGSTGVVMSVPAHAPMDWVVLQQLKEDPTSVKQWGITDKQIKDITPISLIKVPEYGEFPAQEAIEAENIISMDDPNVKQATRLIYRKEHSSGVLKEITGKYQGKSVSEVKDQIIEDFIEDKVALLLKEPGDLVVCRCGTRNHVKFLENQWFLAFGNKKWKDDVHRLLDNMNVFPPEARTAFHNTIDWLENKACARRSGLGTPMPWDTEWIIETLSDSVIYMAYYIVSKYVNDGRFKEEWAVDEVYDYIMLGKGAKTKISKKFDIPASLLGEIREELEYFYGFDLRTSGKDLLTNHLSFMLMHHTAVFPEKYWPKGVAVNGYVSIVKAGTNQAVKMSKSKGNFETIIDVSNAFGVDATRIGFGIAGEGLNDAKFAVTEGESYARWLHNLYAIAMEKPDDNDEFQIDKWLRSRTQKQIKKTRNAMAAMETRTAFQAAHHEILQDIKWYTRRRGSKGQAYVDTIHDAVLMLTPFAPHVTEEIWEMWGNNGFISETDYPIENESLVDIDSENAEKFLSSFLDDMKGLERFLTERGNPEPKTIEVFISPEWMYEVYTKAYEGGLDQLIKRVMENPEMRKIGKVVPKYCQSLLKAGGPPDYHWTFELEKNTLEEAKGFLEREMAAKIVLIPSDESDHLKANSAVPRRPGINFI